MPRPDDTLEQLAVPEIFVVEDNAVSTNNALRVKSHSITIPSLNSLPTFGTAIPGVNSEEGSLVYYDNSLYLLVKKMNNNVQVFENNVPQLEWKQVTTASSIFQGPQGDKGDPGNPGIPGANGDLGPQGPRGPAGSQGRQGDQGQQGLRGPNGPQGPAGPSYELIKGDTGSSVQFDTSVFSSKINNGAPGNSALSEGVHLGVDQNNIAKIEVVSDRGSHIHFKTNTDTAKRISSVGVDGSFTVPTSSSNSASTSVVLGDPYATSNGSNDANNTFVFEPNVDPITGLMRSSNSVFVTAKGTTQLATLPGTEQVVRISGVSPVYNGFYRVLDKGVGYVERSFQWANNLQQTFFLKALSTANITVTTPKITATATGKLEFFTSSTTKYFRLRSGSYDANGANYATEIKLSTVANLIIATSTPSGPSDRRIKDDIKDADTKLCYENIKKLQLRRFKWTKEMQKIRKNRDASLLGVIADELKTVFPKSVFEAPETDDFDIANNTGITHIETDQIFYSMLGAIQQLQGKIKTLEEKLAAKASS